MNRQIERRVHYQQVFAEMPLWETWTDERPRKDGKGTRTVEHCAVIPRRIRRDMARKRAKRERNVLVL